VSDPGANRRGLSGGGTGHRRHRRRPGSRRGPALLWPLVAGMSLLWPVAVSAGAAAQSRPSRAHSGPGPLVVVTSLFPVAQAAELVGGNKVSVIDLTPTGANPRTVIPSKAELAEIRSAAVAVDIGGGFQPAIERALSGHAHLLQLLHVVGGTNPYIWLDPPLMGKVATALAAVFTAADPSNKSSYRQGAEDMAAEVSSLSINFQTDLGDCGKSVIVTAQPSFQRTAAEYDFTDDAVSEMSGTSLLGAIADNDVKAVYIAPLEPQAAAKRLAASAGIKVSALDPIEGLTPVEVRQHVTYTELMLSDLGTLSSALGCDDIQD
jgi:zinc transport system substrate-binding protein